MDHAWDVPPLHDQLNFDLLNVGLLEVTYKLHVHLKAHIILMKLAVLKVLREVGAERNGGRLKQLKPLL